MTDTSSVPSDANIEGAFLKLAQLIKSGREGLNPMAFVDPASDPEFAQTAGAGTTGAVPAPRICCAFDAPGSGPIAVEALRNDGHKYVPKTGFMSMGGGINGYIYTQGGGLIDIGHVREYADYTRLYANFIHSRSLSGLTARADEEGAEIFLKVNKTTPRITTVGAVRVAAALAYQRAVWHEIASYFPSMTAIDQRYSSFSPEDHYSNALGVLIGFRAFFGAPNSYDKRVDEEIMNALKELKPTTLAITKDAIEYVTDHWFNEPFIVGTASLMRRNLDFTSPVTPWLVTDIAIPNALEEYDKVKQGDKLVKILGRPKAMPITIPTEADGKPIAHFASLEFRSLPNAIKSLFPASSPAPEPMTFDHFPALIELIRTHVKNELGTDGDKSGPPRPP